MIDKKAKSENLNIEAKKKKSAKKSTTFKKIIRLLILLPFLLLFLITVYTQIKPEAKIGLETLSRSNDVDTALEQKIKALELWRLSIHDEMSEIKEIYEEVRKTSSSITVLTAKINDAYRNIEKIEQESARGNESSGIFLSLNISHLIYTMQKNSPFNSQIDILVASISSNPKEYGDLLAELKPLGEISKKGAPDVNGLKNDFDKVAQSIIARQGVYNKDLGSKITYWLSKWILIRKIENVKQNEDNIDYILKTVENMLEINNLEQAIVWFEKLNIEQNDIAINWLNNAKNRLIINNSMQQIYNTTIKIISKT